MNTNNPGNISGCGWTNSEKSNIRGLTQRWTLDGEKIFCRNGQMATKDSPGLVVVWATVDPKAGRAGMKSFVVEAGTPGMIVTRLEKKMGLRVSDTAAISFEECHIPFENIL